MESESTPNEVTDATPLLPRITPEVGGGHRRRNSGSATAVLVLSTFVAVSGSYVFGSAVGYSSPAQSGILGDLGLTLQEYSLFGSISTIGAMIGAVVSGKVADLLGRRGAMGFAELFNIVGWIAIAFAKNVWWLDIGRLSTGFGIGLLSYVVPVYIAEITPKNLRGAFTAANQLMICCGASVMYLVGNVISWRLLALIGVIPCLIQLLGLFVIPESPRWLAKIGQWDGSEASLVRLRGKNANIFEEAAEIRDYTRTLEQLKGSSMIDLFQRKYAHSLIVGVGLMVLQQFGGVNAIAYYASAIFSSAGFSYRVGTTAMVIVQLPMTVLGTLLMDKSGRRPLLLVSVAGTCLGCFLIGLSFLLQDHKLWDFSPSLAFGGVLIFTGSFSLGLGGIPWVIMSEIFPINVKGLAGSLVTVVNWFGSWIITYSFNFVAQWSSADRDDGDDIVAEGASVVHGAPPQDESGPPKVDSEVEVLYEKVTKKIMKEGHGQKPSKYSTCFLHYRAWTESTQHKFEDTWHEQQPLELILGKEKKEMTGLAIGISSMKSGERALLHVGWELGYGKEGSFSFPNVPPMADILYEVELIGFDETKEGKARGDMTVEERIGAADRRKMDGNALFKEEKLEEAMQQYEMAIAYLGDDFMFQLFGKYRDMALAVKNPCHLNMAACLIKCKRYEEAIAQCGIVLVEDENNVKALFRRGKARAELGQTDAAREDFLKARKYAPEDKAIAKELRLLAEHDKAVYQKQKELYKGLFGPKPDSKSKPENWLILIWQWLLSLFYRLFNRQRQKAH